MGNCLFLQFIDLFVQVRAINHRLTGSLKEKSDTEEVNAGYRNPKSLVFLISPDTKPSKWNKKALMKWLGGFLPAWMLFPFPAFTLTSLQLSLLQREIWREVTIFNPAMQPHGVQPDRAVWNASFTSLFNTFSPDFHIRTILTCQRGKTTYYFPLHRSSRQLISFGSFLLGQIAVYARSAYLLCLDQPRYWVRCIWQEMAGSF